MVVIGGNLGYANTKDGTLNQRLDEHLIGVEVNASRVVRSLPRIERQLARIARHKGFSRRSANARFRWQDRAFDLATSIRERSARQGFFGVNMASTGCGKTLANGRILYGLAHPVLGARFTIALGLRTLTLQTGDAYRDRLHLGPEDMAVLVGGGAIRALHEHEQEQAMLERAGRESAEAFLSDHDHVHFEGSLTDGPLKRWLDKNHDAHALINAPILVCTIDHLMPATESTRGGHQIAPMLRLLSADLVLDEPDDFGLEDLPALTRLVHWAGMLGSRVLLSSATLPPALIQGLFQAYREGRRFYQQNRGGVGQEVNVCCAWFDEFHRDASDHAEDASFAAAHEAFVEKRIKKLADDPVRRKAIIQPFTIDQNKLPKHLDPDQRRQAICQTLAESLGAHMITLHGDHASTDPKTGKRVSLGLIRMANINPLVMTAQVLYRLGIAEGYRVHLCVYHSRHPLLVRSGIEKRLDRLLNRKEPAAIFRDAEMRTWLDTHPEKNHIFVVLATAVAEVGRDHDYDWAIVEPSSMRSIIQLAGRVRRHRPEKYEIPNLYLLDTNIRHLESPGQPAFCRPGYESDRFRLKHHHLSSLMTEEQKAVIDSSARIRERTPLCRSENLADLEHACLRSLMLGERVEGELLFRPTHWWWSTHASLSGELQRKDPFRNDPLGQQRYGLLPKKDNEEEIQFCRFEKEKPPTPVESLLHSVSLQQGPRIGFWGEPNRGAHGAKRSATSPA